MYRRFFVLLLISLGSETVKIGVSKPVNVTENVTIEPIEITTPGTTATLTTSTTKKVEISTKVTKNASTTTVTTSTTIATTTSLPSTTTIVPATKNDTNDIPATPERIANRGYDGYFCNCDFTHGHCDVNCCCDIDCIAEELNSFDCQGEQRHLNSFHYEQGLPPCKINEGWLCVFRNNFDDSKQQILNYVLDATASFRWPQLLLDSNDLPDDRGFYRVGDPVLLFNAETNDKITYEIPFSILGRHCQIFESVRHLTPQNTACRVKVERALQLEAFMFQKLSSSHLLQAPDTQITIDDIFKDDLTDFIIPITIFRCSKDFGCTLASMSNSSFDGVDDTEYSSLIQTKIFHNITNLIRCDVFFFQSQYKSEKVWQHYQVRFIHVNETKETLSKVSGPLGYIPGSPLIIGHRILLNESADHTDSNLVLSYFYPNNTEEIHIHPPRRRQGQCGKSRTTINFGESMLVRCSVQMDNSTELNSDTNFTRICDDLQSRTLEIMQVSEILKLKEDYLVSILGYPKNNTDSWMKIMVNNYEHLPVAGVYLEKDNSFICRNMILGLRYEFFTAASNFIHGVPHQSVIRRAAIEVERRHDLQFQLDELISIPITFSVDFQDLRETSKAVRGTVQFKVVLIDFLTLLSIYYSFTNV